jgi:hypothetical protein
VASFLEKQGYRAFALIGGYMAWYRARYPIERKVATEALPVEALCPECGEPLRTHASHEDEDSADSQSAHDAPGNI